MAVINVVAYYTKASPDAADGAFVSEISQQQQAVTQFIQVQNKQNLIDGPYGQYQAKTYELVEEFSEEVDRKKKKFTVLEQALQHCKATGAELVIPELQDLVRNEPFTTSLLRAELDFYCLDQPTILRATLPTLVETFRRMRVRHSQRIRDALKQTVAKLGNPNALKEITKVNKPKRENAVMFALMLAPIVDQYRRMGYSQRKMVEALNSDGYLAPEGGQWVLSQLQKVLERIEMNNVALNLTETLREFDEKGYSDEQQIKALNAMNVKTPTRGNWDEHLLGKVKERLVMIKDVMTFNQFVMDVLPQLLDYQESGLSDDEIAEELNRAGINIPERVMWEIQYEQEGETVSLESWSAEEIELARNVAKRREDDIYQLVNPHTMDKAAELLDEQVSK